MRCTYSIFFIYKIKTKNGCLVENKGMLAYSWFSLKKLAVVLGISHIQKIVFSKKKLYILSSLKKTNYILSCAVKRTLYKNRGRTFTPNHILPYSYWSIFLLHSDSTCLPSWIIGWFIYLYSVFQLKLVGQFSWDLTTQKKNRDDLFMFPDSMHSLYEFCIHVLETLWPLLLYKTWIFILNVKLCIVHCVLMSYWLYHLYLR